MPRVWNSTLSRYTPLRSTTGLARKTPLKAGGPLPPINRARKSELIEKQYGKAAGYVAWLCSFPCAVPACHRDERYTVPAHAARTKGAGGTWRDLVPLCWLHEEEWHQHGPLSFDRKYSIRCKEIARDMVRLWIATVRERGEGTEG